MAKPAKDVAQFFCELAYAITPHPGPPPAKRGQVADRKGETAEGAIKELTRMPEASRHVTPAAQGAHLTPTLLYVDHEDGYVVRDTDGCAQMYDDMRRWLASIADAAAKTRVPHPLSPEGRAQRKDTPVIAGVVCSYPLEVAHSDATYVRWRSTVVQWLRERYGRHLKVIVEHIDEARPHLHAIVHNFGRTVKEVTAAGVAATAALDAGADQPQLKRMVTRALSAAQHEFWQACGAPFEHLQKLRPAPMTRRRRRDWLEFKAWREAQEADVARELSARKATALAEIGQEVQAARLAAQMEIAGLEGKISDARAVLAELQRDIRDVRARGARPGLRL